MFHEFYKMDDRGSDPRLPNFARFKRGVHMNSFEDMATRINGYKISCDLLREIEIALLIYEPHDFRKRVIELIKLAEVW